MSHLAHIVDLALVVFATIVPLFLVIWFKSRVLAVIGGALIFWLTIFAAGPIISSLDPSRSGSPADLIWLLFGWIAGLLYASFLYAMKRLFLFLYRRVTTKNDAQA